MNDRAMLTLFTGKERDKESGLDYFGARYYAFTMGRFLSPDPSVLNFADLNNPQSLNLYSYVMNNPLNSIDPNGLDDVPCGGDGGTVVATGDGDGPSPCPGGVLPPPTPPDENCTGKRCDIPPQVQAGDMALVVGILDRDCLMQGLRDTLAAGETPNEPDSGYGTIVKGIVTRAPQQYSSLVGQTNVHLDPWSLSMHPGILVHFGKGSGPDSYSTAAGRYQILQRYAPTPFYPPNQDAYANSELISVHAKADAMRGNFTSAMADAGKRWQSMPGSNLGGKQISMTTAAKAFLQSISGCKAH